MLFLTLDLSSKTDLKLPSMPETSIALVIIRVSRKGTFSGNFSRFMLACPHQQMSDDIGTVGKQLLPPVKISFGHALCPLLKQHISCCSTA